MIQTQMLAPDANAALPAVPVVPVAAPPVVPQGNPPGNLQQNPVAPNQGQQLPLLPIPAGQQVTRSELLQQNTLLQH